MTALPPQPRPNLDTVGFWGALDAGRLAMCRCLDCRRWLQPPLERCRHCGGPTSFEDVSGLGTVHTYTVVRHAAVPGFEDQLPYTVALVELDEQEGLRLPARLVGVEPGAVRVGLELEAVLASPAGGQTVAVFRPVVLHDVGAPDPRQLTQGPRCRR